jgi:D-psicose/D-tagatose/L-ribulose 3-epimerase
MKFGISTWVWVSPLTTEGIAELAPKVKDIGYDQFEVPIEGTEDIDYQRAAAILRDHALAVSVCAAMGEDRDLIHPDKAIRANGMAYIEHLVDAAATLGATNVCGPLYSAVGRTWQMTADERARDTDLLVGELKELAAYAGDKGVVLGVEPLNRFETSFMNLASQVIPVVERVDHPACKIMLDTFHMNIEEQSLGDAIRAVGKDRLAQVHGCENDRGAPGSGHVPWDEVSAALDDIDWDGPIVIESFTNKVKSIARAAAIWRPLAASQDALAVDGLKFLKQQFV